ncbi:PadR family transcriptional regulator [Actinocorallia longicatena]|uniref:PadR family transcriptional regulator n=1 Tax=Actinocorallia longicatena TaxID=111803 RepID=A0ABP6QDN8_9ACTN
MYREHEHHEPEHHRRGRGGFPGGRRGEGPGPRGEGLGRRGDFCPWGGPGGPGGFGGPGLRGGRRGARRMPRGNVRAAILALLAERPMHGYEMIGELDTRTGGIWRPSPGSVYPTLQLLEDEELVTSVEQGGKRLFTITEAGRTEAGRSPEPWREVADQAGESAPHARDSIGQLVLALKQVLHAGDDDQQARALKIVDDARKKLYGILAED